jgi:hypothetical protein
MTIVAQSSVFRRARNSRLHIAGCVERLAYEISRFRVFALSRFRVFVLSRFRGLAVSRFRAIAVSRFGGVAVFE